MRDKYRNVPTSSYRIAFKSSQDLSKRIFPSKSTPWNFRDKSNTFLLYNEKNKKDESHFHIENFDVFRYVYQMGNNPA